MTRPLKWIAHDGEGCPVPGDTKLLKVRFRDGTANGGETADCWVWRHSWEDDDIVAYAIEEDADEVEACEWKGNNDGYYDTVCGNAFIVSNTGTPADNEMKFCCYCGKKLKEVV